MNLDTTPQILEGFLLAVLVGRLFHLQLLRSRLVDHHLLGPKLLYTGWLDDVLAALGLLNLGHRVPHNRPRALNHGRMLS